MNGLIEPQPIASDRDTSGRTIVIAIVVIVAIAALVAFFLRSHPQPKPAPPAYAGNLRFSDLKMSQAQNFAGGTVTYLDGTLSNLGDRTVTRAIVHVTFRDAYGEVAQVDNVPIRLLMSGGPYDDTADLSSAPLGPGQSKRFRLIFEHISEQWNQGYPELQIVDLTTK